MNIAEHHLKSQHDQVKARGWWAYLEEAVSRFFPEIPPVDPALLFAIGSRETNWNPEYLERPGDNGHGFGLMQIDIRSFADWVASGAWHDPRECTLKGAEVLRAKYDDALALEGKPIKRTSGGRTFSVIGIPLTVQDRVRVAVASYNSGRWAYYHASKGRSPDRGSTGGDYSADVLERAQFARAWSGPSMKTCPTCGGRGRVPA